MSTVRIIPRLDIKGPNLVKGINLEGIRVLGSPQDFADYYYRVGADELIYMDVVATLYGRNSLLDFVAETAKRVFLPITVGGGLRSIGDIQQILRAGADKVALNTAAIKQPKLISEAANKFGSSTVVVSIEAKKRPDGSYEAYTDSGRERSGKEAVAWAREACELGAGELLITSIDQEGTGKGCDLVLAREVAKAVSIPVIYSGGVGKKQDILDTLIEGRVNALALASVLHYGVLKAGYIAKAAGLFAFPKHFELLEVATIKDYLVKSGIDCRVQVLRN